MFWSSGKKPAKPAEPAEPRGIESTQEAQHQDQHFLFNTEDLLVSGSAPSLREFLHECDNRYGQHASEYSQFLEKLQDEAIRVQHFKKLTNQEFAVLGITKIGWIMNLREAASRYQ
jgi:hypothetical protein